MLGQGTSNDSSSATSSLPKIMMFTLFTSASSNWFYYSSLTRFYYFFISLCAQFNSQSELGWGNTRFELSVPLAVPFTMFRLIILWFIEKTLVYYSMFLFIFQPPQAQSSRVVAGSKATKASRLNLIINIEYPIWKSKREAYDKCSSFQFPLF